MVSNEPNGMNMVIKCPVNISQNVLNFGPVGYLSACLQYGSTWERIARGIEQSDRETSQRCKRIQEGQ